MLLNSLSKIITASKIKYKINIMKKILLGLLILISGCTANNNVKDLAIKNHTDSLTSVINNLELKIKALQFEMTNGEQSIVEKIQSYLGQDQYIAAAMYIDSLLYKYPETSRRGYYEKLQPSIASQAKKQILEIEKAKKDSIELANINNTGIWTIGYFVDSFGKFTKQKYITNATKIKGTFSNTATNNSDLGVDFIIESKNNISIQLYEYNRDNPVKKSETYYTLKIRDKDSKDYTLKGRNIDSDRLRISQSITLHNILLKGGNIMFFIYDSDRSSTRYNFTINNADWYSNAYKQLIRK